MITLFGKKETTTVALKYMTLTFFYHSTLRYFAIAVVHNWPDSLTWISRLDEFVLDVQMLLEKVTPAFVNFVCFLGPIFQRVDNAIDCG